MDREETEARNDCADKTQQQINRPTEIEYLQVSRHHELLEAMRYFVTVTCRQQQKQRSLLRSVARQWLVKTQKT
jgi:hypothetical protein